MLQRIMIVALALLTAAGCASTGRECRCTLTSAPAPGASTSPAVTERESDIPKSSIDLQALISKAEDGTTVTIPAGRYVLDTSLEIKARKGLTVKFERNAQVLVTNVDADVLTITESNQIKVSGGLFRHVKPLASYMCHGSVIRVSKSVDVQVANADINGCGAIGVNADDVKGLEISHCWIHANTFTAIYLESCEKVKILANVIEDNASLLELQKTDSVRMAENIDRRNGGDWREGEEPGIQSK